jgi:hypothetical protein
MRTGQTPISTNIELPYSAEVVKNAIRAILQEYSPKYFSYKESGINNETGTYNFTRTKWSNVPNFLVTVTERGEEKTSITINCSSDLYTTSPSSLQTDTTEIINILSEKLKGATDEEMQEVIKKNSSGNGIGGCAWTSCLLIFLGIPVLLLLLYLLLSFISYIL